MKQVFPLLIFLFSSHCIYAQNSEPIDVVIPCHEKDVRTLELVIDGIQKNIKNVRRIIVISKRRLTSSVEWFDEANYPFNRNMMLNIIFNGNVLKIKTYQRTKGQRTGWIFQQLLKLYAPFIIPDISSNVLVVDADTIFLKPVEFIDAEGFALYAFGDEFHKPYFDHAQRLLPEFKKLFPECSGICHHMLFQRATIEELFQEIQKVHNCEPWVALCKCIDHNELLFSALSEYEIYFNYVFLKAKKVKIRRLNWINVFSKEQIARCRHQNFDFVSWHNYLPENPQITRNFNEEEVDCDNFI